MVNLDLKNIKLLGIISSVLMFFPNITPFFGFILLFATIYFLSKYYKDKRIFNNFLISFIFSLISISCFFIFFFFSFLGGISSYYLISELKIIPSVFHFFYSFLAAIIISWIFAIISSIFLKRSYDLIANYSNVSYFKITGTLYLIGSVLLIVLVGALILFIALVFQVISFAFLPEEKKRRK